MSWKPSIDWKTSPGGDYVIATTACDLTQWAEAHSTSGSEVSRAIDRLLEENISVPEADEETCRRFYDNHPDSFKDEESGERLSFNQAQIQIQDYLHTKAIRMAVAEYIKALSYSAEIKGIELVNL